MDFTASILINLASLTVAAIALVVSFGSFLTSLRAFRLSQAQENRRKPALIAHLLNGYVQYLEQEQVRVYAFMLSISNPSDSNNALARAELRISYKTPAEILITMQISAGLTKGSAYAELSEFPMLTVPVRLDAHQTVTGWTIFRVAEPILKGTTIEGYVILLFDSHNIEIELRPIMVPEYTCEILRPLRENPTPR